MPLTYLLYRCPRCGHDPLSGEKDRAWCPECGAVFERGGEGGRLRVTQASGEVSKVAGGDLAKEIANLGGPLPAATDESGILRYAADVDVRYSGHERPVWFRGELVGFAEKLGDAERGTLSLEEDTLRFRAPETVREWPLMELRAVQTSSSSLQMSPVGGGLVEFKFLTDSPKRWEDLLRAALKSLYRERGAGEIVEFQPRIVVRP